MLANTFCKEDSWAEPEIWTKLIEKALDSKNSLRKRKLNVVSTFLRSFCFSTCLRGLKQQKTESETVLYFITASFHCFSCVRGSKMVVRGSKSENLDCCPRSIRICFFSGWFLWIVQFFMRCEDREYVLGVLLELCGVLKQASSFYCQHICFETCNNSC